MQRRYEGPSILYKEDPDHTMPSGYMPDDVYAAAITSMVIVCTDAIPINRDHESVYLARRAAKPCDTWWFFGGRTKAGEEFINSIRRNFRRETTLDLPESRFSFLTLNRYMWKDRQQEPQDAGSDNLALLYSVELTAEEPQKMATSLEAREYVRDSFREFTLDDLLKEQVHPAILDAWDRLFVHL